MGTSLKINADANDAQRLVKPMDRIQCNEVNVNDNNGKHNKGEDK
jgi:hypothetical protein